MKKGLLFIPAVFAFFAQTAFLPVSTPEKAETRNSPIDLNDWLIDKATFDRMYEFYKTCRGNSCRAFKKYKRNEEVRAEIEKNYTILNEVTFMGRYSGLDVARYKRARKFSDDEPKGRVNGFSTIITRYEVVPKNGFVQAPARFLFSDEYTICPPPDSPPC